MVWFIEFFLFELINFEKMAYSFGYSLDSFQTNQTKNCIF